MDQLMNRRDLLKLAGMGVAVFVSGTTVRAGGSQRIQSSARPSYFSHVAAIESSRVSAGALVGTIDGSPVVGSVETETIRPPA